MMLLAWFDPVRWMPRPEETPLDYWISLSPMAPVFGIAWRFGGIDIGPDRPVPGIGDWAAGLAARAPAPEEMAADVAEAEIVAPTVASPEAPSAPPPAPPPAADDLKRIRGIGPGLERELNDLGIRSLAQIAAMTPEDVAALSARLTRFRDRPVRDDWVGQANQLTSG
jgi:predicted flap endonuclease-1-like 5' DNA nuclease